MHGSEMQPVMPVSFLPGVFSDGEVRSHVQVSACTGVQKKARQIPSYCCLRPDLVFRWNTDKDFKGKLLGASFDRVSILDVHLALKQCVPCLSDTVTGCGDSGTPMAP